MEKIDPAWITENFISLIGREWMLVTAGDASRFTMTASWGGVGYLWNKPVVFVFVRPERYTVRIYRTLRLFYAVVLVRGVPGSV